MHVFDALVGVQRGLASSYPEHPPFDPDERYPEYRGSKVGAPGSNHVYAGVRALFRTMGWDAAGFGTANWNPLGDVISPGDRVVLKPNLISEGNSRHPERWQEVVTHPAVIRAVLDYVLIALDGRGDVVIADGPQTDSDFDRILSRTGLAAVLAMHAESVVPVRVLDLRRDRWHTKGDVIERRESLPGDPAGYVEVDLAERSAFGSYRLNGQFYGADYDIEETRSFHSGGRHAYVLSGSIMNCDVLVNLPKLKTHKKTGVTVSLKNMVGVNGYRNCLPHFSMGSPSHGGDESPERGIKGSLESRAIRTFKKALVSVGGTGGTWARVLKRVGRATFGDTATVIRSGNWEANDTVWRMVLDLNQIVLWHDGAGQRTAEPRRYLSVVDGIIGGQGDGPSAPDVAESGVLVCGRNPWAVDWVATEEMGLRPERVPMLERAREESMGWLLPAGGIERRIEGQRSGAWRPFETHFGWPGLRR